MKKLSKKAIYAMYGIEYNKGKIKAPIFGWINPLLVNGNEKIGTGVYHFSTLPTNAIFDIVINGMSYSVKGTCPCYCPGCYATKGNYNYNSVKASLAIKTILARECLDFVKRAIIAQIKAEEIKMVRIHASGDFFSLDYITVWHDIAIVCKDTVFWSYTKNSIAENSFDDLDNINIVKSIVKGHGFNFGTCAYILKVYKALKASGKEQKHVSGCTLFMIECKGGKNDG